MFKIVDYKGETVADNFSSVAQAGRYIVQNFTSNAIRDLELHTVREEEEDDQSEI